MKLARNKFSLQIFKSFFLTVVLHKLRPGHVVLQRVGHVVAVAKVEVGGHVHGLEVLDVLLLVGRVDADALVGHAVQLDVLDLEDGVVPHHGHLQPPRDQDDVVALKKANKTLK